MDRRSPPDAPAPPPAPASGPDGEEIARLFRRIEAEREALVALTRDLIRFPTVNPPGDAYEACARFLGARLAGTGA
ncbi:MAG: hypothetical protein ACK4YX_09855, partial [Rhabdaerophilum calidifontis]